MSLDSLALTSKLADESDSVSGATLVEEEDLYSTSGNVNENSAKPVQVG